MANTNPASYDSAAGHTLGGEVNQHVESFIVARSYAPASARQRRHLLGQFHAHVGDDLTVQAVYSWWASISHLADATRRAHLSAVRQYLRHLVTIGVLDSDPTATISAPRVHHAPPVTITPAEAVRFLACVTDPRVRVAAALMLGCGLRAGDVTRLDTDNVSLTERILRVDGKGHRVRLVPIPDVVADILATLIDSMCDGPLIRTSCGRRLSPEQLRYRLTRELERAGIKRHALDGRSSHVLRRTCATTLLEHGATLPAVQAILGHTQLSSTQRYLAVPEVKALRGIIEAGPLSAA
jgi:integrase/recombinase XerD